jgi:hypothetical protein
MHDDVPDVSNGWLSSGRCCYSLFAGGSLHILAVACIGLCGSMRVIDGDDGGWVCVARRRRMVLQMLALGAPK